MDGLIGRAAEQAGHIAVSPHQESHRQRIERQKKAIEDTLADLNRALELLDKNPSLEEFYETMRRVSW